MSAPRTSVSVVLCTFNGELFLREQLQTILDQTRPPDEIVVSDDGSTDATLDIVREIRALNSSQGSPKWQVLTRASPMGVAGNFSSAIARASGDVIVLSDQDDVWEPHRIERGLALLHDGALLVHSDAWLIDDGGNSRGTLMAALGLTNRERRALLSGHALDVLLRRNVVTGATTMMRSSLARQAPSVPDGWIHDEWFALIAATQGGVVFCEEPLIRYRQHGQNHIGASKTTFGEARKRLGESRTEFFRHKLDRNKAISAILADEPSWLGSQASSALAEKVEFEERRSALPARRLGRLGSVLTWWVKGDYDRYSRGYLDVVRDIFLTD